MKVFPNGHAPLKHTVPIVLISIGFWIVFIETYLPTDPGVLLILYAAIAAFLAGGILGFVEMLHDPGVNF